MNNKLRPCKCNFCRPSFKVRQIDTFDTDLEKELNIEAANGWLLVSIVSNGYKRRVGTDYSHLHYTAVFTKEK